MPKKIGFSRYEENFPGSDVTADEWEILQAMDGYQKRFRRRFPSWREVLGVLKTLGYRKVA
ncbi:MAG: hypothetical protein ACRC7O_11895, partial [Fimbriiglobus sp.]